MKKILILFLLIFTAGLAFSQEYLVPLSNNPWLSSQSLNRMKGSNSVHAPMSLPFLDDFSHNGIYPSSNNWIDQFVYINNDMCKYPPSLGVATFDALNDTGALYPTATSLPFIADNLTSNFINLASNTAADSLYLSFFFQPGGRGNSPETGDSLILEFLEQYRADTIIDTFSTPDDTTFIDKWARVWASQGMDVDTFHSVNHSWFKLVLIPITNSIFFRNDFQFRFFNYASLGSANIPSWRSNADMWNLDYVYLNSSRTYKDTIYNDLTFVNPAPNMLSRYTSMPMRQYLVNPNIETKDSLHTIICNLWKDPLISLYHFDVQDPSGATIYSVSPGNYNIFPFYSSGYLSDPPLAPKFADFTFPAQSSDSSVFTITHILKRVGTAQEFISQNDTVRYYQKFYNYLAYDDGTAEAGYGLSPDGSMLAYRFKLNTPDTLRGIQMFFNRTLNNASQRNFSLMVWADDGGKPGSVLYKSKKYLKPQYSDSLNKFYTYILDTANILVLDNDHLTFYVGWIQQTDDNLNVGWDSTSNAQSNIFYSIDGSWQNTEFHGALMIRPCLGPTLYTGKKTPSIVKDNKLTVYPNPNNGHFIVSLPSPFAGYENPSDYRLSVYNIIGEKIAEYPFLNEYDLSFLPKGMYVLQLNTTDHYLNYQAKVVLTK